MSKGQDTKTAILDEALQIASQVGFEGLTIGQLAERTEMSKSGLFAHFRSKEQLQLQTLEHSRRWFIDTVIRPALAAPRGEARVRALFDAWLRWEEVLDGGCVYVTAAVEYDDRPGAMRDALVQPPAGLAGVDRHDGAHRDRGGRLPRGHRPGPVRLRAARAHPRLSTSSSACSTTTWHCGGRARPSSAWSPATTPDHPSPRTPRMSSAVPEKHDRSSQEQRHPHPLPHRRAARSPARRTGRPQPVVHRPARWPRTARCHPAASRSPSPRWAPRSAATSGARARSSTSSTAGPAGAASSPASSSR